MINTGYSRMIYMNEKVQGELADALKSMDNMKKSQFMRALGDIDFSRSISSATVIKSASDKRLKDPSNIIIGVYTNAEDNKKYMVAYKPGFGPISEDKYVTVFTKSGKEVKVKNFGDLSWSKWLELMSSVYVIDSNSAISVKDLKSERFARTELTKDNIIEKLKNYSKIEYKGHIYDVSRNASSSTNPNLSFWCFYMNKEDINLGNKILNLFKSDEELLSLLDETQKNKLDNLVLTINDKNDSFLSFDTSSLKEPYSKHFKVKGLSSVLTKKLATKFYKGQILKELKSKISKVSGGDFSIHYGLDTFGIDYPELMNKDIDLKDIKVL